MKHALVIGGSMSGLFAGTLLRKAGLAVDIYERADVELTARGAGIVTHPEMRAVLRAAGCDPTRDLGVEVLSRRTLDRSGRVIGEHACPQTLTSWDRVFRMLREKFPAEHYHLGKELTRIEQHAGGVTAHFADGSRADGDLLIGADGFRSTVRGAVLPEVGPIYAGYVGWRGLLDEAALSATTHAGIFDAMVFGLPPNEQFISYPIAGPDNNLAPGRRRCNFVWYRPAAEANELRLLLTDARGRTHPLGIPPPLIRPAVIAGLRESARVLLAPQLAEVVQLSPQPFLQPIFDVESKRMAVGRVGLIGDAAFLARPHVAVGVTKAAEDALTLATALQSHDDVVTALAAFEQARMPANQRFIARGRVLGGYLAPQLMTPAARAAAEQRHTPEAVMREIAVLDF
jgi:2-polyprenyl-6-methoxyphenol hydroxylase-like FAD-dependent oxidoreductase